MDVHSVPSSMQHSGHGSSTLGVDHGGGEHIYIYICLYIYSIYAIYINVYIYLIIYSFIQCSLEASRAQSTCNSKWPRSLT